MSPSPVPSTAWSPATKTKTKMVRAEGVGDPSAWCRNAKACEPPLPSAAGCIRHVTEVSQTQGRRRRIPPRPPSRHLAARSRRRTCSRHRAGGRRRQQQQQQQKSGQLERGQIRGSTWERIRAWRARGGVAVANTAALVRRRRPGRTRTPQEARQGWPGKGLRKLLLREERGVGARVGPPRDAGVWQGRRGGRGRRRRKCGRWPRT